MSEIFVKNSFCSISAGSGVSASCAVGAGKCLSAVFTDLADACALDKNAEKNTATAKLLFFKITIGFLIEIINLKSNAQYI